MCVKSSLLNSLCTQIAKIDAVVLCRACSSFSDIFLGVSLLCSFPLTVTTCPSLTGFPWSLLTFPSYVSHSELQFPSVHSLQVHVPGVLCSYLCGFCIWVLTSPFLSILSETLLKLIQTCDPIHFVHVLAMFPTADSFWFSACFTILNSLSNLSGH